MWRLGWLMDTTPNIGWGSWKHSPPITTPQTKDLIISAHYIKHNTFPSNESSSQYESSTDETWSNVHVWISPGNHSEMCICQRITTIPKYCGLQTSDVLWKYAYLCSWWHTGAFKLYEATIYSQNIGTCSLLLCSPMFSNNYSKSKAEVIVVFESRPCFTYIPVRKGLEQFQPKSCIGALETSFWGGKGLRFLVLSLLWLMFAWGLVFCFVLGSILATILCTAPTTYSPFTEDAKSWTSDLLLATEPWTP